MDNPSQLIAGRRLTRSAILNFFGQVLPFLAALIAIPFLVAGLGTDRFGVLTLAWVLIGYFGLFDLGLGRALTQLVAKRLHNPEDRGLPELVWTALLLMTLLGLVGAVMLGALSSWLAHDVLSVPPVLAGEATIGLILIAVAIPFVTNAAGLRGILEAHQRFDLIVAVGVPMRILSYLGPAALLSLSNTLELPIAFLLASRVVTCSVYLVLCLRIMPALGQTKRVSLAWMPRLFRFGGWMTVTNIIGPVMVYFDRFFIVGMLSVAAVAYYSTPYDFVTRLLIIPASLAGVLFPAFATLFESEATRASQLYLRGARYIFIVLWPIVLLVGAFSYEILDVWVGADFAEHGGRVMRWLAIGILFNGLAQIPFVLVQGSGRPDLTAKLHLAEAPFYLVVVWWLISSFGIDGAAMAWTLRVFADTAILFVLSHRLLRMPARSLIASAMLVGVSIAALVGANTILNVEWRIGYCAIALVLFGAFAWRALVKDGLIGLRGVRPG